MSKFQFVAIAVCVTASFALGDVAFAQQKKKQKLSYEEAWKRCTAEIDKAAVPKDWPSQRQAAGAACMKKYGYKI